MAVGHNVASRAFVLLAVCLASSAPLAACSDAPPPPKPAEPAPKPEPKPKEPKPTDIKPVDTKPVDAKPVDVKPVDVKPVEPKPADTTTDPDLYTTPANPTLDKIDITLGGRVFHLEQALTNEQRFHGLSGRTEIPADGGMIFVFKDSRRMEFVMRDCPADIDIIFVNRNSRITAMHHMAAGPRRTEAQRVMSEPYLGAPKWAWGNSDYESKLKKYSSRFDACVVIELKGGTLKLSDTDKGTLELKVNEDLKLDIEAMQKKAE